MGWSPPKKITVVVSLFLLVFGLLFGVVGVGIIALPPLTEIFGDNNILILVGLALMFVAWLVILLGVTIRGI